VPKPLTAARLEASALFHLERFASSSANLRRILLRRVQRSAELHGTDPEAGARWVEALLARFLAAGLLDDRAYATAKAAGLHRRGASARAIRAKLATKGLDREVIEAALGEEDCASRPGGDLAAAAAFARRRRLGPYRSAATRETTPLKDLAAFARGGFSRQIAERVLGCADPEAVDGLLRAAAESSSNFR
jgi:regulatory protein